LENIGCYAVYSQTIPYMCYHSLGVNDTYTRISIPTCTLLCGH